MLRSLITAASLAGVLASASLAQEISILQFQGQVAAFASSPTGLHRLALPGGAVLASETMGRMARVDVEQGVDLVCSVRGGLAGRMIHGDVGTVEKIELADELAVVMAERGTAIYFAGQRQLLGLLVSEGYPDGVMAYGAVAAASWSDRVTLYGTSQGQLQRLPLRREGMIDLHVGPKSVLTIWQDRGTFLHVLTPRGFQTVHMSPERPGNLSARVGIQRWVPVSDPTRRGQGELPHARPLQAEGVALFGTSVEG